MNSDDLGDKGEKFFASICTDKGLGLVCNKADRDRMGWDFIVEFKFQDGAVAAFDKRPKPLSCHFQVKTVFARTKGIKMLLSSAEYIAKEPKPSFVYVLVVDDAWEPVEAYLIHLLGEPLAEVLKRLRAADARGETKVNTSSASMAFRRYGAKIGMDGAALRAAIHAACGGDVHAYIKVKKKQLDTIGYEGAPLTGTMTIKPRDNKELVEILLGNKQGEVSDFRLVEKRFGIERQIVDCQEGGKVSIRPNPLECRLVFHAGDRSPPIVYRGELIVTPMVVGLPPEALKAVIKADLFSGELTGPRRLSLTFGWATARTAKKSADDWAKFFRVLYALARGTAKLDILCKDRIIGRIARTGRMQGIDMTFVRKWKIACERISDLFVRAALIPGPELSMGEIQESWNWVWAASDIARGTLKTRSFMTKPSQWPPEGFRPMKAKYVQFVCLGQAMLAVWASCWVTPERDGDKVNWVFTKFGRGEVRALTSRAEYEAFVSKAQAVKDELVVRAGQVPVGYYRPKEAA